MVGALGSRWSWCTGVVTAVKTSPGASNGGKGTSVRTILLQQEDQRVAQEGANHRRVRSRARVHVQGMEHGARVAQKTSSNGNGNQTQTNPIMSSVPRHRLAHPVNDTSRNDGTAPAALTDGLGDVQREAGGTPPNHSANGPTIGTNVRRG